MPRSGITPLWPARRLSGSPDNVSEICLRWRRCDYIDCSRSGNDNGAVELRHAGIDSRGFHDIEIGTLDVEVQKRRRSRVRRIGLNERQDLDNGFTADRE